MSTDIDIFLSVQLVAYTDAISALAWLHELEYVPDIVLLGEHILSMTGGGLCLVSHLIAPSIV